MLAATKLQKSCSCGKDNSSIGGRTPQMTTAEVDVCSGPKRRSCGYLCENIRVVRFDVTGCSQAAEGADTFEG